MEILIGTADTLSAGTLFDMARYRHRVFVQKMGWPLKTNGRVELDQFDRRDTIYVLAREGPDGGELRGMARLLPTQRPYLLADVFPQFLLGRPAPRSPRVWELSRFAAVDFDARTGHAQVAAHAGHANRPTRSAPVALDILDAAMAHAAEAGAHSLVALSPLGVERILRRAGVVCVRAAPPMRIDAQPLFVCWIDLHASLRARVAQAAPQ